MFYVSIGMAALFFLFSVLFFLGKGTFLIAGSNVRQGKEEFDVKALCRFFAVVCLIGALAFALMATGIHFEWKLMIGGGLALLFADLLFAMIFTNTGNRFRK